jgi:hypothetical protein
MIANGRGSVCLAGAASMKHRVPAAGRLPLLDIAQWNEQQPSEAVGRRFESFYLDHLSVKQDKPTQ